MIRSRIWRFAAIVAIATHDSLPIESRCKNRPRISRIDTNFSDSCNRQRNREHLLLRANLRSEAIFHLKPGDCLGLSPSQGQPTLFILPLTITENVISFAALRLSVEI